eukprot:TRINITY_DN18944_c0_g1_i1.p1 TRINITY_DN18944_c0_g1~~TRINITY_DN18944_c0_g1_i1.p1  ORF type:complete len:140 (-),score=17.41 TRINITY_DN18944_c0_g1_i1:368-787(-)
MFSCATGSILQTPNTPYSTGDSNTGFHHIRSMNSTIVLFTVFCLPSSPIYQHIRRLTVAFAWTSMSFSRYRMDKGITSSDSTTLPISSSLSPMTSSTDKLLIPGLCSSTLQKLSAELCLKGLMEQLKALRRTSEKRKCV